MPRPTIVASQPTTNNAGAERPSMVKVEVPARRHSSAAGPSVGSSAVGDGGAGPSMTSSVVVGGRSAAPSRWGSGGESGKLNARAADPARAPGSGSRPNEPGSGSARIASGSMAAQPARSPWSARQSRSRRSVRSPRGRCGSASMAAAGTSRRSKSLPHQAHSDQSIPTSRLQLGQTRLSRVRQDGQMIHSSSIRRSHDGQWWIDSTSASRASSARLRSQTSPIFSCGRTIL